MSPTWEIYASILAFLSETGEAKDNFRSLMINNGELIAPDPNETMCKKYPCGLNADCLFGKEFRFCRCHCGYFGNPHQLCEAIPYQKSLRAQIKATLNVSAIANLVNNEDIFSQLNSAYQRKMEIALSIYPYYIIGSGHLGKVEYDSPLSLNIFKD